MRYTPSDPHATRKTLLFRLRQDGPEREVAWQEFHDCYAPLIGGFARRMGAASDVVDDVVQDVLLGFFSASPEFQYKPSLGRFRGYLKTCTWRKLRKRLEADRRIGARFARDVDAADVEVEAIWEDTWEREKVHRALDLLRERYSTRPDRAKTFRAFELSALLDRAAEDIAEELGMSIDSVHQAKSRVTRALRETMDAIDAFAD